MLCRVCGAWPRSGFVPQVSTGVFKSRMWTVFTEKSCLGEGSISRLRKLLRQGNNRTLRHRAQKWLSQGEQKRGASDSSDNVKLGHRQHDESERLLMQKRQGSDPCGYQTL